MTSPDDTVRVPREPTETMLDALRTCESYCENCKGYAFDARNGYAAMLAAAPAAQPAEVATADDGWKDVLHDASTIAASDGFDHPQDAIGWIADRFSDVQPRSAQVVVDEDAALAQAFREFEADQFIQQTRVHAMLVGIRKRAEVITAALNREEG